MKRLLHPALALLLLLSLGFLASSEACAQRPLDSITVLQTPGGTYVCCFDLIVRNRQQDTTLAISEVRLRIISGRATFLQGFTESPRNWTVLSQTASALSWSSNSASADIRPSNSQDGFRFCAADTGVMRIVWETRNIDSVISTDTLVMACTRPGCDEAFFRVQPSQTRRVVDIDVVAGNGALRKVNTLFLHPVTPGVSLSTAPSKQPAGWVRLRVKPDTIMFFTQNNGLDYNEFAEGFRIELENVPADSAIRIEYWTAEFGETICVDTVTLRFGLSRRDTVYRLGSVGGSDQTCCVDLVARNTHEQPRSVIELLTLKVTTVGARIDSLPIPPQQWTVQRVGLDSVVIRRTGGFQPGDTVLLPRLCINNANASGDTIAYRWTTFGSDIPITSGSAFYLCLRPFANCDSVSAVVDSTFPSPSRCISLTLRNRNSRRDPITTFALRISNPGTARRVLSATPPSPWRVAAAGGDSVIFTGGNILPGGTAGPFTFCTTLGDTGTRDPLTIAWTTGHRPGTLCGDTLRVNAVLAFTGDSVRWREIAHSDPAICCFGIRFLNRNTRGRTLDRASLAIPSQTSIFTEATAPAPWQFAEAPPSFDLSFQGGTIVPGGDSPEFTVCLDMQQFPTRPATIPVVFRTFAGDGQVFFDTVRLVCGTGHVSCDSLVELGVVRVGLGECRFGFRLINMHDPAGPVDGLMLRRVNGGEVVFDTAAVIGAASTAGWSVAERLDTLVRFSGPALPAAAALETFLVGMKNTHLDGLIEISTTNGGAEICAVRRYFFCEPLGVDLPLEPTGFSMEEPRPNPARNAVEVPYMLRRGGDVRISLRDMAGREIRSSSRGRQDAGRYSVVLDLAGVPSGTYYCTVRVGEEYTSRRVVVVR